MPPPKSPFHRPGAGQVRRPSGSKRTNSSEKTPTQASTAPQHGTSNAPVDHATSTSAKETVSQAGRNSDGDVEQAGTPYEDHEMSGREGLSTKSLGQLNNVSGAARQDLRSRSGHDDDEGPMTSGSKLGRLRQAMDSQLRLNQQRQKPSRNSGKGQGQSSDRIPLSRTRTRVSPINEETMSPSLDAAFASPFTVPLETTSTESAKTVRGSWTPSGATARTPSYPFPPMRTPSGVGWGGHRPFTALSPTIAPDNFASGNFGAVRDRWASGSATPASSHNFQPGGNISSRESAGYPSPNLYDLSLALSAEPGLDPWWTTVVHIMKDVYKADRVTLTVPADPTDIENVPWGQKATFNAAEEDQLSLAYLPRGSSLLHSSGGTAESPFFEDPDNLDDPRFLSDVSQTASRPGLVSRHSFTAYEDTKIHAPPQVGSLRPAPGRPNHLSRSKSYVNPRGEQVPRAATLQNAELSLAALQEHLAHGKEGDHADWEDPAVSAREVRGRVFPVLQALDYEADPLLDNTGVIKILERGKVITLTRDYPYLDYGEDDSSGGSLGSQSSAMQKETQDVRPGLASRMSSFMGSSRSSRGTREARETRASSGDKSRSAKSHAHLQEVPPEPKTARYEEYEQIPASPWSQSPAPSPAVRSDTTENPFFVDANVDEDSFNPSLSPHNYSETGPVEAIGVDRSWTLIHVPLTHLLLSKPAHSFRLDTAAMESKYTSKAGAEPLGNTAWFPHPGSSPEQSDAKRMPIAILSLLAPVVPYPSNLVHSLEQLAPHLATSFSLCRHYSHLETEIAGLTRKRPQTTGFGGVTNDGRPLAARESNEGHFATIYSPEGHQDYTSGSVTSPSDYSAVSRSNAGSAMGTPNYDPGHIERRSGGGSPGPMVGSDNYFATKRKSVQLRPDSTLAPGVTVAADHARQPSNEGPALTSHHSNISQRDEQDSMNVAQQGELMLGNTVQVPAKEIPQAQLKDKKELRVRIGTGPQEAKLVKSENRESSPTRSSSDNPLSPRRQALRTASEHVSSRTERMHSVLHSYGADYSSTFQSLPNSTVPPSKPAMLPRAQSSTSVSSPVDMPPPSDRLKGLMLDSLPAHVFVALPQTGEIVWVNNRYLAYRGQSVAELYQDPWSSIHPDEREDYLKAWSHALRTGEQFSKQTRIRRFDGTYRWFYTRAVGSRDTRGVIVQWYGSHMDIHDQHIAEVKAARQEEIEASEAKHRLLANLIPQIIFAATEDEGVTFANEQWLSYTGQEFEDSLGLGFMDYVHPEDLAQCFIPVGGTSSPRNPQSKANPATRTYSQASSGGKSSNTTSSDVSDAPTETTVKGLHHMTSHHNNSGSDSVHARTTSELSELARHGVISVATDSTGRLSYTTEVRLRTKSGEYRWHLVRCVEVDNISFGSGSGSWFGACTDINDHKLLETKLKEAMESKSKFLSNMSHEIRTPLIGISGMVSFLQDTVLNEEQLDYTNTIQTSANSLLMIINDILDLSKVDAGMMKLSYEWFHTRSLIEDVNELVSTMAISKRLELNYVVDEDVPAMVKGDKVRIRQVLLNVIGNAIKFTQQGEVFSRCKVYHNNQDDALENEIMLEYSIVDTGRGFTKEEAELIFKPFSQIDGSSTRQHGGSGLGLVISRQLVELHGGNMTGTAVAGQGSTFTFTARFGLPTEDDQPEPVLTPHLTASTPSSISAGQDIAARLQPKIDYSTILSNKLCHSPPLISPKTDSSLGSPAVASSASSDPSIRSGRTYMTERSSASSINTSLTRFGDAARATDPDAVGMRLELPSRDASDKTPTQAPAVAPANIAKKEGSGSSSDLKNFRPPMYSILVICPQTHSREATTQHIEMTLPKDVPHQITALSSVDESQKMIGGEDPVVFTHIVLNLSSAEDIVILMDQIFGSVSLPRTSVVILSDPVQRQVVMRMASDYDYDQLAKDNRVNFVYKPVKPSRFAVIFDPDKERDLSTDRNRSSAQQMVATQKANYLDVEKRLGNKGYKVLLVEDNLVNQKVLLKFLSKVGIKVEIAMDGVECTEKVFSHDPGFYSLVLVCITMCFVPNPKLTFHSATFICLAKMATKPAAISGLGKAN